MSVNVKTDLYTNFPTVVANHCRTVEHLSELAARFLDKGVLINQVIYTMVFSIASAQNTLFFSTNLVFSTLRGTYDLPEQLDTSNRMLHVRVSAYIWLCIDTNV